MNSLYSIDIISQSPSVRTYLTQLVMELLSEKVEDEKVEELYKQDEVAGALTDGETVCCSTDSRGSCEEC